MKIAIYHPQLNNYGGGETVALTIASSLSKKHQVDIFSPLKINKEKIQKFYNLNLVSVNLKSFGLHVRLIKGLRTIKPKLYLNNIYRKLEKYDLVIDTATNGWFDKKLKTKTICYVHYPFFYDKKKGFKKIIQPLVIQPEKAFKYDKIICNSDFTKKIVKKYTKQKLTVINPPVKVKNIKPRNKKNIILTIGRFSYDKKHEIMIDSFKKLYEKDKTYEFHIIGSYQENVALYKKDYFEMLKKRIKGYPIKFHVNLEHPKVLRFLEQSKIYWHARGYGETDLNEYENFGITTVEAMAAGCVPVVINLGAQPDIVKDGINGFVWKTPEELIIKTMKIIKSKTLSKKLAEKAIKNSKLYSKENFEKLFAYNIFN